jgi:hypothetical protein
VNISHHFTNKYLVNKQLDPENHPFLLVSLVFQPLSARVYVNLPEGKYQKIAG